LASNINIVHGQVPNHDPSLRAGIISWSTGGSGTYFQTNWTAVGTGIDISSYTTLEMRVSRQSSSLNLVSPTNFSVEIEGVNGATMSQQISNYIDPNFDNQPGNQSYLQGPVGSIYGGLHPILQTVRIPLANFPGWQMVSTAVHGIRLTFDQTNQGAIYVANIRLSTAPVNMVETQGVAGPDGQIPVPEQPIAPAVLVHSGSITALRNQPALAQRGGIAGVEVEIISSQAFPVRDSALTLSIGSKQFTYSRYATTDLHRIVFSLTAAEFASLSAGDPVLVQYGKKAVGDVWNCGKLNK
jgi:hypothetical protein